MGYDTKQTGTIFARDFYRLQRKTDYRNKFGANGDGWTLVGDKDTINEMNTLYMDFAARCDCELRVVKITEKHEVVKHRPKVFEKTTLRKSEKSVR